MKARSDRVSDGRPARRRRASAGRRNFNPIAKAKSFPVVGVGASAGGYEAFTKFLEKLPADTGMAFVFIQHLDPKHESRLAELLGRATRLPVIEVKRPSRVQANHVYVIAPNKNLIVSGGYLRPSPRRRSEIPPMPIDHFLRSLAEERGQNGIGVILSGNGSDGTHGLQAIKGADGITFAQAPATAKYSGMPASAISSGCVDFILPPADMPAELAKLPPPSRLNGGAGDNAKPEGHASAKIYSLLRSASGVDFSLYKQTTIQRRIAHRMVVHRINGLDAYVKFLQAHPEEVDRLSEDVLITVTRFFRDSKSLQILVKKVFPALLNRRPRGRPIRIWVPGCSSGEEVYSLAMLLSEFLGNRAVDYPVQIFGTDVSERSVARARAGLYPDNIAVDVSPERLRRFFTPAEEGFRIAKPIRDKCVFARQDLVTDPPFSQLDLISCQNVLIYLGPELQQRVLRTFHYALKPHGFLVLGSAEGVGAVSELFALADRKERIYTKTSLLSPQDPAFSLHPRAAKREPAPAAAQDQAEAALPSVENMADRMLLEHFAPNGVVVDSRLQVIQFRGQTAPYLEHKPGAANLSLLKLLNDDLVIPVRAAVTRAQHQQAPARKEVLWTRGKHHRRLLKLDVIPFRLPSIRDPLLLILFEEGRRLEPPEVGPAGALRGREEASGKSPLQREVVRLREELERSRESLRSVIEEQEATNEELRSANEESQSSNEELQSTNEELETAKEEMQSTNEELATVNDELQSANLEANRVNNDLVNLLASVQIPVVMLDNSLLVRRFTPSAQRFFSLIPSDIGRSLTDIKMNLDVSGLDRLIRGVIETLAVCERQVQDSNGRWFSLRIRPYRTKDNKIDGAVLALVDVDDLKRGLDDMSEMMWEPFLALTQELRVVKANGAFYEKFRFRPAEVEGRYVYDLGNGYWDIPRLRKLLNNVLPLKTRIKDFVVEHTFPEIGPRKMLLNARELEMPAGDEKLILLAIKDVTADHK